MSKTNCIVTQKDIQDIETAYDIEIELHCDVIPLSEVVAYVEQILSEYSDREIISVCFEIDELLNLVDVSFDYIDNDDFYIEHYCYVDTDGFID